MPRIERISRLWSPYSPRFSSSVTPPSPPAEDHLTIHDAPGLLDDAQNGPGGDALATAAFAHHSQSAARTHPQTDSLDGLDHTLVHVKVGVEVTNLQQITVLARHGFSYLP